MKGAVAAGHPLTAEAACEAYERGGNAFDAAIAALAAACVVEPVLTSLGGGGFLLARPEGQPPRLYDFFVQTPRRKRAVEEIEFYPIVADFGTAQQEFHIGAGAIATPGTVRGMVQCQHLLGRLPLQEVLAPSIRYASDGVEINPLQAYIFRIVAPIYEATAEAAAHYDRDALQNQGRIFRQPDLADTLSWIAEEGDGPLYAGEIGDRLIRLGAEHGGQLTKDDLRAYQVVTRQPLQHRYRGYDVATNPPPSAGGLLINFALELLDPIDIAARSFGHEDHVRALSEIMAQTNLARRQGVLNDPAAHPRLLEICREALRGHPLNSRGTTHISTIDAAGNAASLTLSNGEGSGRMLPGSGIMLNNMLGEEDLNPGGFHRWQPDVRVGSMMAPTLAEDARHLIAIGSGGSNRLRTAILQTLSNLIDFGMTPETAVNAPRIHVEHDHLDIEPGLSAPALAALTNRFPAHRLWSDHNLFFGGTHTVCWDGRRFSGAGDPRRGGVFREV